MRELQQICKEELPEYVQPVGYKFLDELPLTPIGKVDYRKLEEGDQPPGLLSSACYGRALCTAVFDLSDIF